MTMYKPRKTGKNGLILLKIETGRPLPWKKIGFYLEKNEYIYMLWVCQGDNSCMILKTQGWWKYSKHDRPTKREKRRHFAVNVAKISFLEEKKPNFENADPLKGGDIVLGRNNAMEIIFIFTLGLESPHKSSQGRGMFLLSSQSSITRLLSRLVD